MVTSGARHLATARLKLAGVPLPKVMVTADDVVNGKPHPEPYLKGAELLGVNPAECLVIEDAPAGIRAAHAGGMKAIGLTSTYPASALSEADWVVGKLAQIQVSRRRSWGTCSYHGIEHCRPIDISKSAFRNQRSQSSSSIPRSVFSSRYFTITGVYNEIPHSAAAPFFTARDPGTTTAPSGTSSGVSGVARYTSPRTRSYKGVDRVKIVPAPSTARARTSVPS